MSLLKMVLASVAVIEKFKLHASVLAELNLEKRGAISNLIAELLKGNHN